MYFYEKKGPLGNWSPQATIDRPIELKSKHKKRLIRDLTELNDQHFGKPLRRLAKLAQRKRARLAKRQKHTA